LNGTSSTMPVTTSNLSAVPAPSLDSVRRWRM